jgi:DNA-binding transcriptional MerR regulator
VLKIGDFSKFGHVSVKTLRYYDDAGLLKPVHVDPWTNYRYYSMSQLPRLNRILALKHLGFTLEQMGPLLNDDVLPEHLRHLLERKQTELIQRMEAERAVLARVEARLRQLAGATAMAQYDVVLKRVAPQHVASVRKVVPTVQDMVDFSFAMGDVLAAQHVPLAGPWLHVYYQDDYREADLDVETVVPISDAAPVTGLQLPDGTPISVRELPAVETMASTIHQGAWTLLDHAYAAIGAWIEHNGYQPCGPSREIFLQEDGDPTTYVTEIQFPVTHA